MNKMDSALNPEAPEFYPSIASITQSKEFDPKRTLPMTTSMKFAAGEKPIVFTNFNNGFSTSVSERHGAYTSISKTVTLSNRIRSGDRYEFLKKIDECNIAKSQLSENVLVQSNLILMSEMPSQKLTQKCVKNTELVVDSNDRILDRFDIKIDALNRGNTINNESQCSTKPAAITFNSNIDLEIAKIELGSARFIGAKNILRPQLTFKDPVDNTDSLWVPKISNKPNSIKPLALSMIYNYKGEPTGYEHPYKVEIDLYDPPQMFIDPDLEPPTFPLPMAQTKFTYIDTESKVDELVEHLSTVQELAVDLEHHSYRTYQGITCLIQISTKEGGDFIIDALAVREHIHKLNLSFTDPKKLKVFHGADMDVKWLQRDFGVYIVGLFDTHQAAKTLMLNGLSLKHMLMNYCGVNADKTYQLADWRMRPLSNELIDYARQDTHYLLYVWRRMKADLLAAVGGGDQLLRSVFNKSKLVCGTTYNKTRIDDTSHLSLYIRSKRTFDSRQMAALKLLYKWRDTQARLLDESTSYLLPNHMLISLAGALPREIQGVHACCSPMSPPFVKQNLITIHRMILSCRELPLESVSSLATFSCAPSTSFHYRPAVSYEMHDFSDFTRPTNEDDIGLEKFVYDLESPNWKENKPQLAAIVRNEEKNTEFVSNENLDVEMYIPPYYRYRGYRFLAKEEQLKQIEEKKVTEVAIAGTSSSMTAELHNENLANTSPGKNALRKRKMSTDHTEMEIKTVAQPSDDKPSSSGVKPKTHAQNIKPYNYDSADYNKIYDRREIIHKQQRK